MPDSLKDAAENLAEIVSDTSEFKDPLHAKTADALKRFAAASGTLATKAKQAVKTGLDVNDLVDDAYDTAKKEKNARAADLKKAWDSLMAFVAAAKLIGDGDVPTQFKPAGDDLQKVLDRIEFTDKKQIGELRKKAQAYYPAESALAKEAEAWSVRAEQVAKAVKASADKLDPSNSVEKVHIAFLLRFAKRVGDAAKIIR